MGQINKSDLVSRNEFHPSSDIRRKFYKVAVLVFSVERLRLLSYNNHLFVLCFSLNIQEDLREEQTQG